MQRQLHDKMLAAPLAECYHTEPTTIQIYFLCKFRFSGWDCLAKCI